MADQEFMRHAFTQMLDRFQDSKPAQVLFTSFTFSATFFENNVLPLLCGNQAEELKGAPLTRDMLNQQLAGIETVVVCDRSAHPEPKGNLRYGLLTVGLRRGRFHPKIILMSGTLRNGDPGLWLSVGSANLSYSAWAVQREVVGSTPVTLAHAHTLQALLAWLLLQAEASVALAGSDAADLPQQEEGDVRNVLRGLQAALAAHAIPEDSNLPTLHLALPPEVAPGHPPLLAALTGAQPWRSVTAISPFWGGVPALLKEIKAESYHLVPSLQPTGGYAFPDVACDIPATISYQRFKQDAERYTHAKALVLDAPQRRVLCIGSANFTTAALLHGAGPLSNVEAMLRYRLDRAAPWTDLFTALERNGNEADNPPDEGAPPLPPFEADVLYDWRRRQFLCRVQLIDDAQLASLVLQAGGQQHHFHAATRAQQQAVIDAPLRQPVRSYQLTYTDTNGAAAVYVGLVTQVNGHDDQLDYSPRPRLDLLLGFLHGLDPAKGDPRDRRGGGGGDGADLDGDDVVEPVFDFFSFFRGTAKLRSYYDNPERLTESPYGQGAIAIPVLLRAVMLQPDLSAPAQIGRYVQLAELGDTIDCFDARPLAPADRALALRLRQEVTSELARLETLIAPLLSASKQWRAMFGTQPPAARTFLQWFLRELKLKQGKP